MFNIIIGLIFVIGGLSGKLTTRLIDSPELLAAIGTVLIVWGITQVLRKRRLRADYEQQQAELNPTPEFKPPSDNHS